MREATLAEQGLGEGVIFQNYIREDAAVDELDERNRPVVWRKTAKAAQDYRDALVEVEQRIEALQ